MELRNFGGAIFYLSGASPYAHALETGREGRQRFASKSMAKGTPQPSFTVFVPRWRLFAYRAAGWRVIGCLNSDFVEIEWPLPGAPVFLPPCNMSGSGSKPLKAQ